MKPSFDRVQAHKGRSDSAVCCPLDPMIRFRAHQKENNGAQQERSYDLIEAKDTRYRSIRG